MDLRLAIRNGLTYAVSIAAAATIFTSLTLLVTAAVGSDRATPPFGVALAIAVVVAVLFQPLTSRLQASLDRYVHRETYDYQHTVRDASSIISTLLELQPLVTYLSDVVADTLKPDLVAVYLRDSSHDALTLRATTLAETSKNEARPSLSTSSPLAAFCTTERRPLICHGRRTPHQERPEAAARDLHALGGEIALPFFQNRALSGLLVVGPKLSGGPYSREDIDLLTTLTSQAALALKNAELYEEVVLVKDYIENILVTMESAVVAVAADETTTLFNAAAERLTGLAKARTTGHSLDRLPASVAVLLRATLADGKPRVQIETAIQHPPGHVTPVICSTSPLKDSRGLARGAVAVFNDLTQLKRLEDEKRQAERLASVGALASGLAHEIKNPLVAIKTFAELLPERFADEDFRSDFANVVIREIDRIDDLVARLRGLAMRPSQPTMLIDLREPIEETLALLRGQLEHAMIRIRQSYPTDLPFIAGDHDQLKQLFLNVLMNSLEAMDRGGELSIELRTRNGPEGRTVLAEVIDTGAGISTDLIARIFDPFVTTKSHGSGLGLSISRGIADAHRASIRARGNEHGHGTTILIEFPVPSGPEPARSVVQP